MKAWAYGRMVVWWYVCKISFVSVIGIGIGIAMVDMIQQDLDK